MNEKRRFRRTRLIVFASLTFVIPAIVIALVMLLLGDEFKNRKDDLIDAGCCTAITAFFVWLAVWISNRRTKLGWRFWSAAWISGVLLIYLLSFGPACRLCEDGYLDGRATWIAYRPMTWLDICGPGPVRRAIDRWIDLFRQNPLNTPSYPIRYEFFIQYPDVKQL